MGFVLMNVGGNLAAQLASQAMSIVTARCDTDGAFSFVGQISKPDDSLVSGGL